MARYCGHLQHLILARCTSVSDSGIKALAEGIPQLRTLDLSSIERITDHSLLSLIRFQPQLEQLNLKNCPRFTEKALSKLSQMTRVIIEVKQNSMLLKELSAKSRLSVRERANASSGSIEQNLETLSPKRDYSFSELSPERKI